MEGTTHFGCWCQLCMLNEWMELEEEINQLVFGSQESYYATLPSPTLTRCTLSNSPVASTSAASTLVSTYGTSLSPNEEAFLQPRDASKQRTAGLNFCSQDLDNMIVQNNKELPRSQRAEAISPKIVNKNNRFLMECYHTNLRGLQPSHICIPPRPTAKRQKKTLADLGRAEPPRCNRLHVSNIPFWFEDHHLVNVFQDFGNVVQAEVIYNDRGSKGFGFVTFEDETQATNIRRLFDGLELHGRVIEVNYASKRQSTKSKAPPQRECAQPVRPAAEDNVNGTGSSRRRCEPPLCAAGRPGGAGSSGRRPGAGASGRPSGAGASVRRPGTGASGRPSGAGAPLHSKTAGRASRVPPMSDWPQHHRRKFGPRY